MWRASDADVERTLQPAGRNGGERLSVAGRGRCSFLGMGGFFQCDAASAPPRAARSIRVLCLAAVLALTPMGCGVFGSGLGERISVARGGGASLVFHTPAVRRHLRASDSLNDASRWEYARRDASLGVRDSE